MLKTVRLLKFLHLMSRRNLLGLPEGRPIVPDGLEKESGIPCIDPGGGGWFGRVAAQSPFAKGTSNEFSEASRRTNKELGMIELFNLGESSQTVQCTTCLKDSEEGAFLLHMWCMSCAVARTDRGPRHGPKQWQYDHWKAKDAKRGLGIGKYTSLLCTDNLLTHTLENPNGIMDVQSVAGLSVNC